MLDQLLAVAGGAFLLTAVALAVRVDRAELRQAGDPRPWAPTRLPALQGRARLRLLRLDR